MADAVAFDSAAGAGNTVAWTPTLTVADSYDVFVRWHADDDDNASNASFTVTHADGSDSVTVNQQSGGGVWYKLGTYEMAPGQGHKVSLSDRANGVVVADAVQFVSAAGGERLAIWEGTAAATGVHQVWARWPAAIEHATSATFRLIGPDGTETVLAHQRSEGGAWQQLGTFDLDTNDDWRIELSDVTSGGAAVADAIAVVPAFAPTDRYEWEPTLTAAGDYAVYAKWIASADRAVDATYEIVYDGGVATVAVDQRTNGGQWRYLGMFPFDPAGSPQISLLASASGTVSADAVRLVGGDQLGGTVVWLHSDHLGTPQKASNLGGQLAWDLLMRPYGETAALTALPGTAIDLRFPGQYADETGLHYNYQRDYDPTLGRYITSDPIGLAGGLNTYAYALDNPLRYADPSGLNPFAPAMFCLMDPPCLAGVLALIGITILEQNEPVDSPSMSPMPPLPRSAADFPYPNASCMAPAVPDHCEQEWEDAFERCEQWLSQPYPPRYLTGGYDNPEDCARGHVSEECGGNPLGQGW